jgi:hypothetical protein
MITAAILTVAIVLLGAWLTYATHAIADQRMDKTFPHPVTCQVQRCRRPVSHRYARHPSGQVLYICERHAGVDDETLHGADFESWDHEVGL